MFLSLDGVGGKSRSCRKSNNSDAWSCLHFIHNYPRVPLNSFRRCCPQGCSRSGSPKKKKKREKKGRRMVFCCPAVGWLVATCLLAGRHPSGLRPLSEPTLKHKPAHPHSPRRCTSPDPISYRTKFRYLWYWACDHGRSKTRLIEWPEWTWRTLTPNERTRVMISRAYHNLPQMLRAMLLLDRADRHVVALELSTGHNSITTVAFLCFASDIRAQLWLDYSHTALLI